MSTILVTNIPSSLTKEKLSEFFSFCGVIKNVSPIDAETDAKHKSYIISFESDKALQTALLLNDAELEEEPIKVEEYNSQPPSYNDISGDHKVQYSATDITKTGDQKYDETPQEDKPKYAIMAQMLASGYALSDSLIEKAIEADKDKRFSEKFYAFVDKMDKKLHQAEPTNAPVTEEGTGNSTGKYSGSSRTFNSLANTFENYKGKLNQYIESGSQTTYGKKLTNLYERFTSNALAVHEEAKRLAAIKKNKDNKSSADSTVATDVTNTTNTPPSSNDSVGNTYGYKTESTPPTGNSNLSDTSFKN